jgi:hypothetical protein
MAIPFDSTAKKREPAQPVLSLILGGWLIASAPLLGYSRGQAINAGAVGAACILISTIAMTTAPACRLLTLLATWLVVSTCAFPETSAVTIANNVAIAIAMVWVSTAKGSIARR